MNFTKLKIAEEDFLRQYPGGFDDPDMREIVKKHHGEKMRLLVAEGFAAEKFGNPSAIVQTIVQVVGRSSVVSLFEKPKCRDYLKSLSEEAQERLAEGLQAYLYGDEQTGFEAVTNVLRQGALAKWTLVTVCPSYFSPNDQVFVKPSTAKGVIDYYEIENLHYQAQPTYAFYAGYRDLINDMKRHVSPLLSPDNLAFGGFLMMSCGIDHSR